MKVLMKIIWGNYTWIIKNKVLKISKQCEQEDLLWFEELQVMDIWCAWALIEQQRLKTFEFLCIYLEHI